MPDISINKFDAGWTPCDDPISGRKNGLLKMDNLELDSTGALTLQGGTSVRKDYSGLAGIGNAHTLFSRLINGVQHDYLADSNGNIFRDTTSIASGGDSTNAAFGTAFNFTLACSGANRLKDDGINTPLNLGINPPTAAPTVVFNAATQTPSLEIGPINANLVNVGFVGNSISFGSNSVTLSTVGPALACGAQSYIAGGPFNCLTFAGGATATDDDLVTINGTLTFGLANLNNRGLTIQILLTAGDSSGDQVSDYYTYSVADLRALLTNVTAGAGNSATGSFQLQIPRGQFTRIGSGSQTWATVYGFRFIYGTASSLGVVGESLTLIGNPTSGGIIYFTGGSNAQNGSYQYVQINVNNTSSYIGKSIIGPISAVIAIGLGQALITPQNPTIADAQCNEAWIYRIGGNLDQWYRVLVFNATTGFTTPTLDTLSDQSALTLNITINLNLISINVASIPDKIFDIVGPLNGRWYYFTTNFMYPSDLNDPDLVDASLAIRVCGNSSELFMWARLISSSVVLVGTSIDIYQLSGTFATLPDNSIDIYYLPIGCKYPPITCDVDVYGGSAFYLANDGWRMLNGSGQAAFTGNNNNTLTSPNLDRLYRGETVQGYEPPPIHIVPRSARFPVVIAKNKLYCFITGINSPRIEIYDFIRQYWTVANYSLGDVSAVCRTQDSQVLAFFTTTQKTRSLGIHPNKLIDGATKQNINLLTMVYDGDTTRQRKVVSNFRSRSINTDAITVNLFVETGLGAVIGTIPINVSAVDNLLDISSIATVNQGKTYQVALSGVAVEFILNDLEVTSTDLYPIPCLNCKIPVTNFETAAKKRVRTWPFILSSPTANNTVTFVPTVDGVAQPAQQFNVGLERQTFYYYFKTDVFGVDYSGLLKRK